jgi:transcriptional/translational regulatory protein YebC/TACO1
MGAQWKQKGRTEHAAAKGRLFTKLVKELVVASKAGGPDPATNPRLRMAMDQAKKASMPLRHPGARHQEGRRSAG